MLVDLVTHVIDLTRVVAISADKPLLRKNDSKYTVYADGLRIDVLESVYPRAELIKEWSAKFKPKSKAKKATKSE